MIKEPTEDQILISYFDWIKIKANSDSRYAYVIHVPNEANRGKWGHIRANKKGLAKGILDVLCLWGSCFAIEFKSKSGKVSTDQIKWIKMLLSQGWKVGVFRDFEGAKDFTENFFLNNKPRDVRSLFLGSGYVTLPNGIAANWATY